MSARQVLALLTETPFGPFLDAKALHPKCLSTPTRVLQLDHVLLEYDGRPTGLDETEQARPVPIYLQNKPALPEGARIRFRGVLTIDALSQLTLEAIDAISAALQMRQTEAQINGVVGARGDYFKPQVLYSDRGRARQGTPRIKVLIQGVKHMPFVYLASKLVPNGLQMHTENHGRMYEVLGFRTETYELSRSYLGRYKVVATIEKICKDNPDTEPAQRTPDWFIAQYLKSHAYPEHKRWNRLIYNSDAADTADEGVAARPPPQVRELLDAGFPGRPTKRPRHLRTVHRSEVASLFASVVEFVVEEYGARQRKLINVDAWRAWTRKVNVARRRAARADPPVPWGLRDFYDGALDEEGSAFEDDEPVAVPTRGPSEKRKGKAAHRPKTRLDVGSDDGTLAGSTHPSPSVTSPTVATHKRGRPKGSKKARAHEAPVIYVSEDDRPPEPKQPPSARKQSTASGSKVKASRAAPTKRHDFSSSKGAVMPLDFMPQHDEQEEMGDRRVYDSDFSEDSTPDASSDEDIPTPLIPLDPEILALIPPETGYPPRMTTDFKWVCPVGGCMYSIDLMRLTDENVRPLPREQVVFIRSKRWVLGDSRVQTCFYDMVSPHYEWHINEKGVRRVKATKEYPYEFKWINPRLHKPWPPLEWVNRVSARRDDDLEEESSQVRVKKEVLDLNAFAI